MPYQVGQRKGCRLVYFRCREKSSADDVVIWIKAQEILGWQPTIALEQGLTRTIAYFDDLLRRNAA